MRTCVLELALNKGDARECHTRWSLKNEKMLDQTIQSLSTMDLLLVCVNLISHFLTCQSWFFLPENEYFHTKVGAHLQLIPLDLCPSAYPQLLSMEEDKFSETTIVVLIMDTQPSL